MKSFLFAVAYWLTSIYYVVLASLGLMRCGREHVVSTVQQYSYAMVSCLRVFAGIDVVYRNLPKLNGPVIFAAKHHSWFDGFSLYATFPDLAFVSGDHLLRYPLLGGVLRRLGAVVVSSKGGVAAQRSLLENARKAIDEGRSVLIYPEGHLSPAGQRERYRTGVWHIYRDANLPVIPVATNLGVFAPEQRFHKTPGEATLDFLPAIPPGLGKKDFMERLEAAIEHHSDLLIAEATGQPYRASELKRPEGLEAWARGGS